MIILLTLVFISIVLLLIIFKNINGGDIITITKIENKSPEIITYTIPYLLAFININFDSLPDIISMGIFLIILMILTISSKSIFINPILALVGYGLYDIDYIYNSKCMSKVVLCRNELIINDRYYIKSLTPFLSLIGAYNETEDN